jgi:hypothetical protein
LTSDDNTSLSCKHPNRVACQVHAYQVYT